jgi:hypothetical protein
MIYRIYIGYNGTDIGQSPGIPGLTMNASIEPGWMLQHFEVVYKTAYVCSQANYGGVCDATNQPAAVAEAARINGSADTRAYSYFSGGESMLEYYPGQTLLGNVQLADGSPVGGARVTVTDGWGIPHESVLTAPDGSFSVVLPPGNDTVNITMGSLVGVTQQGQNLLKSVKIDVPNAVGLSFNAPNLVQTFTVGSGTIDGFVFWENVNSTSYHPSTDTLIPGAQVVFWGSNLTRHTAITDASGAFNLPDVAPGVYDYAVLLDGRNYSQSSITLVPGTTANATAGILSGAVSGTVFRGDGAITAGAVVTLSRPGGTASTDTTDSTGSYRLTSAGPGNYTVSATVPGTDLRSAGVPVEILSGATNLTVNLTVLPSGQASFSLTANGFPVSNVPVRFTPVVTFSNASASPLGVLQNITGNSTVVVSSSSGFLSASLPVGTYSAYAYGMVNGQWYTAVGSTTITAGVSNPTVSLSLTPTLRLSGTIASVSAPSASVRTAVVAYSNGAQVVTWASGGSYSLSLPSGSYNVQVLVGASAPQPVSVWSAIASVSLTTSTTLSFTPVLAERVAFTVGAPLADGRLYPAAGASAVVSAGPGGAAMFGVANATGSVALYVPSTLPLNAGSYCLATSAFGFASTSQCDLSPSELAGITRVSASLTPVPETVTVQGLPSGTPVTVNFTAESATAVNRSVSGGPTFSLALPPGDYSVSARAVVGAGNVVYLPTGAFSTTLPLGGTSSQLTIFLVAQVNATGTLSLPTGASLTKVTVALTSPSVSVVVNGSAYESGFRAAPGTYSAYVTTTVHSTSYATVARVSVAASGTVTPTIVLSGAAATLQATLVSSQGTTVPLNTTVTLVTSSGAAVRTVATNGTFRIALSPSTTYSVFANGTALTSGPNGSYEEYWSTVAGASCTTLVSTSVCSVSVVGVAEWVSLNGTLFASGVSGPAPGTVLLVGPYPSESTTTVAAPSGSFSVALFPGDYSLYAVGTGTAQTLAGITNILALPSTTTSPISVTLVPTWVDTVTITPPTGGSGSLGPVTLTVTNSLGAQAVYPSEPLNSPIALALPIGAYTVAASATGTLGGVATNATASESVTILGGNVGTVLSLAYLTQATVAGTLVGPTSATVAGGGSVSFAFTVRDTGNVPVTVSPVGTPSYWNFTFNFANVTLLPGPTGATYSGEATVVVPAGTAVAHPTLTIEFEAANGSVLGQVSPAPTITVVGYYGVAAGASPLGPTVTSSSALIPFYLANTGNQGETVVVSIADTVRLAGLGWTSGFDPSITSRVTASPVSQALADGGNATLYVNLTSTWAIFVPPGSVTLTISVLNASGSLSKTLTLSVPVVGVRAGATSGAPPLIVTGPSLGSAPNLPPVWLVPLLSFVPAIALVVGVLTYRWWRTRRWTRR